MPARRAGSPVQRLAVAEHGERDAGGVQQLGHRAGGPLGAVLVGAGAADPEQVVDLGQRLDVRRRRRHLERQVLGPVQPQPRRHAPRVGVLLEVLEQAVQLGGERRLDEHLVAAHVDDRVDVLDVDRALLDAGAAGRAGPQHVLVDDARLGRRAGCTPPAGESDGIPGGADQRTRPRRRGLGLAPRPRRGRPRRPAATAPWRSAWSRSAITSSLGDSGLSVFQAGHWDWQRPHSVQVVKSSRPFQVKSSTLPTPSAASSSRSSIFSKSIGSPPTLIGCSAPSEVRPSACRLSPDVEEREEPVPGHAHRRAAARW